MQLMPFEPIISTDDLISFKTDLEQAALQMSVNKYGAHVFKEIGKYLPFDICWIGLATIEGDAKVKIIDGLFDGYTQKMYEEMVRNAEKHVDCSIPTIYYIKHNMTKVIIREDYWCYEEFRESQFFLNHSQRFGQHHFMSIAKPLGFLNKVLSFVLYSSEASRIFNVQESAFFQEVSLPLLDIFNSKLDVYNSALLPQLNEHTDGDGKLKSLTSTDDMLPLIRELTKSELKIIRVMAEEPKLLTAKQMGDLLFKSKKTIENRLGEIYSKLHIEGIEGRPTDKKYNLCQLSKFLLKSHPQLFDV